MLDENLPTFFLKPSADKVKHHEAFYFTQNGSEPEAQYALHHVDPVTVAAKNTYAVALFDSHNPAILYGEVLAKPGWSHPTLSQEEIRKNGGVPPPPQPIFPTEVAVQLYNPDTRVVLKQQTAKWSSTVSWEFSLPQITFRTPSASDLDRTQNDPSADMTTPRVNFVWRKEGRLGKDITCYMTGKSTDPTGKKAKKSKEPDIAVALFSGLKEMTIMEPNLYRVELEDYKGLEVALLLGGAVIRDLFFSDANEQFHISDIAARKNSGGLRARKGSSPLEASHVTPPVMTPEPPPPPPYSGSSSQYPQEKVPFQTANANAQMQYPPRQSNNTAAKRASLPPLTTNERPSIQAQPNQYNRQPQQSRPLRQAQGLIQQHRSSQQPQSSQLRPSQQQVSQSPRLDPRAQWEIDAETARLKAQVEAESAAQKRTANAILKARKKADSEAERKTLAFLEQERKQNEREEKERRKKQTEIDKETARLRRKFGDQSGLLRPNMPPTQRHSTPLLQGEWASVRPAQATRPAPVPAQPVGGLQVPGGHRMNVSHSSFFSNGLPRPQPQGLGIGQSQGQAVPQPKVKKSFWGLRTASGDAEKLKKKKSSMF